MENISKKIMFIVALCAILMAIALFGERFTKRFQEAGIRQFKGEMMTEDKIKTYEYRNILQNAPQISARAKRRIQISAKLGEVEDKFAPQVPEEIIQAPETIDAHNNKILVILKAEYLKRNGDSITTYDADFGGEYAVKNPKDDEIEILFSFPLPQTAGPLSNVEVLVDGKEPEDITYTLNSMQWNILFKGKEEKKMKITYKATRGFNNFIYQVVHGRRLKNFDFIMKVSGVEKVNFPPSCMLPTSKKVNKKEQMFFWKFKNLITNYDVGIDLPYQPTAIDRIDLFFKLSKFSVIFIIIFLIFISAGCRAEKLSISYEHYILLSIAFYLFYPLTGYLSALFGIKNALIISAFVILIIILNHIRRISNIKFSFLYAGVVLFILLAILPITVAYPKYAGITYVTCGLILLQYFMQIVLKTKKENTGGQNETI